MKKLLCLISNMNAGGAETFLMKIYREIDKSKYQMDFCVNINTKGFYDDEIEKLGGKIYHITQKSKSLKNFNRELTNIIKTEKYDYVLRITSNAAGFMDLKIAKKAGAKVCCARSSNSSDGDGLKAKIAHAFGRTLYGKYIDVKFAPSDLAAKYTFGEKAYANGNVSILRNAVDIDLYLYDEQNKSNVRKEFGISDDVTVIGHIGRFMKQKNHQFLIDVFSKIHKKNPETVLLLVGDGELKQKVEKQICALGISDCVLFAGIRSDVPAIYSALDIIVMPSLYEGMPNVVIEAQVSGLPCVISDTITKEANITGLVKYVPLENGPEFWADTVLDWFKCHKERRSYNCEFINAGYDISTVTKQFVDIIFKEE